MLHALPIKDSDVVIVGCLEVEASVAVAVCFVAKVSAIVRVVAQLGQLHAGAGLLAVELGRLVTVVLGGQQGAAEQVHLRSV